MTELGNMIDSSQSYISQITTGKIALTKEFADKLYNVFPIDANYQSETFKLNGSEKKLNNDLPKESKQIENVSKEDIYTNNFGVKFIPIPNGKFQMIVPVLNAAAQASYIDNYQDVGYVEYISKFHETESFLVDRPLQGNYVCFKVINDSMANDNPRTAILPEDEALTRELQREHWKSKLKINDFPEWVIFTTKNPYPLIKNITNHDVENGIITCHSYNEFVPDFDLSLNDVQALFYVIDIRRKRNNKFHY
ncbi:MAG: hypothetical protein RR578_01560 [Bacilli bacterium]